MVKELERRSLMKKLHIVFFFLVFFPLKAFSGNPLSKNVASVTSGAELYKKRCSNCHGDYALGKDNGFFLSPNLTIFEKGYKEFLNVLKNGYGRMPALGGGSKLNKTQLDQLTSYLESISSKKSNWK